MVAKKKTTKKKTVKKQSVADGIPVHCAFDEILAIDKIRPYPRNSNVHPPEQIRILAKLLFGDGERNGHGWRLPITISNRSGFVVRGHGRLEAARLKGLSQAPVDYQDYESEEMERADRLADNRINELSHFDRGILRGELEELDSGILDDMELTGFDRESIEELFTAAPPEDNSEGEEGVGSISENIEYKVVVDCESEKDQKKLLNI